ncbi:MAG: murein L,D-transpeptidase [Verrucomicrobiaceae bacterium]|nr:MAG: murein L,D-transpeptidase [Verrucomicrobiaceae bacterium]
MKKHLHLLFAAAGLALLAGCATKPTTASVSKPYKVVAYKPRDPNAVKVKVSTSTQNVYVVEGDRVLMAVQGCVGTPQTPTPAGSFRITNKIKNKRRISQPGAGYPMGYWCEFKPAYGFHEGFVHPVPRTHGCIRLHREAAARLFALVKPGTPVYIASTQPEDATAGRTVQPLDQSRDPNPPMSALMSPSWFQDPEGPLLIEG